MAAYPTFPDLSRKPALKTKWKYALDPTLRSDLENGMESTRARFTRPRREWTISLDFLTNADLATLRRFVEATAIYGAKPFYFPDTRDAHNPVNLFVRFSKLPEAMDAGWIVAEFRQSLVFELREV